MISKKYEFIVFVLVMSFIMSVIMSGCVTFINIGFDTDFFIRWFESALKAYPIGLLASSIGAPLAKKISNKICSRN